MNASKIDFSKTDPSCIDILLADDDKDDRFIFKRALLDLPFPTRLNAVTNGKELMQLLHHKAYTLPSVLFLDLNMPLKNGFECLKEIRADHTFDDMPVIMYSTLGSPSAIELLYKGGAQYFLKKPNEYPRLKRALSEALAAIRDQKFKTHLKEEFILDVV